MAKIHYAKKFPQNDGNTGTPLADINAEILAFWGPAKAEKRFPIAYWHIENLFKDYKKVAIYINSEDQDDMTFELIPFISTKMKDYDAMPGFLYVLSEIVYNSVFREQDKVNALCLVRVGKDIDDELIVFLHKTDIINLNNGNAGPDPAGSGTRIPPHS